MNVMTTALLSLLRWARDAAIPPTCMTCHQIASRDGGLCATCWSMARFIERPYCEVLGVPFPFDPGEGALSAAAIADPPPFARHRSVLVYNDVARKLVVGLKFADRGDLAPWMAQMMTVAGRELIAECDVVIPVPLHRLRLHSRRYNQSGELARHIARRSALAYEPLALLRRKNTPQQVGLGALERARNVQGAFHVPSERRALIAGRRVLLVDDVHTTGATARACTRSLMRAGAGAVDVLTFASAVGGDI